MKGETLTIAGQGEAQAWVWRSGSK